jgi:hypothetical protein
MFEAIIATMLFTVRVNDIRAFHEMPPIQFSIKDSTMEYALECDPVRKENIWFIMSSGTSSCGKNTFESRADMIYAIDEQYADMRSPFFDADTKSLSVAVSECPNDKIFVVAEDTK